MSIMNSFVQHLVTGPTLGHSLSNSCANERRRDIRNVKHFDISSYMSTAKSEWIETTTNRGWVRFRARHLLPHRIVAFKFVPLQIVTASFSLQYLED